MDIDAAGLDWAEQDYEVLCQHVLEHGTHNWAHIAAVLKCPVELLALKWEVLRVRVQEQSCDGKHAKWSPRELDVLLRGINAFPGLNETRRDKVLALWLPGRTHYGVKQALKKHVTPYLKAKLEAAARDELPQTVTGVLMMWQSEVQQQKKTAEAHAAREVANYLLNQAPELLAYHPLPKTAGIKRKRTAKPVKKHPSMPHGHMEQADGSMTGTDYQGDFTAFLGAGAAAAGGTSEGVLVPPGSCSPALSSSSSSMVWPGISAPGSPVMPYQGVTMVGQLLPHAFTTPHTTYTQLQNTDDCSSLGADGLNSSRSTTTAMAAGGFNTAMTQFHMLKQQSQACVVHRQQLGNSKQNAPTKRKRSRLSQSASQSMQHAVAPAAATGLGPVPGHMTMYGALIHGMPGHAALTNQAARVTSSGTEIPLTWTMPASAGAQGPGLLVPTWNSSIPTGAGTLLHDDQTTVFDWSIGSFLDGGQQLQAAAPAAAVRPSPANRVCHQMRLPSFVSAATPGQQLQYNTPSWQQDSLALGAMERTGIGAAAASSAGAPAAAAACEAATVQLSEDMVSGCSAAQQIQPDWQQAQPLDCMTFETVACGLPAGQQAADAPMHATHELMDVTAVLAHAVSQGLDMQTEQPGFVTSYTASDQGSATASPTATSCHFAELPTQIDRELQELFDDLDSRPGVMSEDMEDDGWLGRMMSEYHNTEFDDKNLSDLLDLEADLLARS